MIPTREILDRASDRLFEAADRLRVLWMTRRWRLVAWVLTLVPLLVVVVTTIVAMVLLVGPGGRIVNWYNQRGTYALGAKDYTTARLCYSGLLQHEPENPKYQFGLALSLFGLGENGAAIRLTHHLAPDTTGGYAPAHVFVAEQLLANPSASDDDYRAAEWHLLRAVQSDPADKKAHALLAAIYARSNRWQQVKEHLPLAGDAVDEIGLMAAQSFAAEGDTTEADAWAKRAVNFYRNKCLADRKDAASRMKWAQGQLFLRDYASALETLETGWKDFQLDDFRRGCGVVILNWLKSPSLPVARRVGLLQQGIKWDSRNPGLLIQLTDPVIIEVASKVQRSATAPTEGFAVVGIARAVGACRAEQPAEVRRQLEIALSDNSVDAVEIAANVSCLWAYSNAADATASLILSSALVDLRPTSAAAQRAQGLILARQGRYNVAAAYLESAMKAMPADLAIHGTLAQCYEHMGMPDYAAEQRRLAQPHAPATTQALPGGK